MFDHIYHKVERAKRTAVIGLGAGLCLAVGAAFLTGAAWIALVAVADVLTAALVIGGAYFGVGLVLIALTARKPKPEVKAPVTVAVKPVATPELVMALMQGVAAGAAAAQNRR